MVILNDENTLGIHYTKDNDGIVIGFNIYVSPEQDPEMTVGDIREIYINGFMYFCTVYSKHELGKNKLVYHLKWRKN